MKQLVAFTWLALVGLVMVFSSCAEESQVGYGLVGDDELGVEYSEDFILTTETVSIDSVVVVSGQSLTNSYFLGSVRDTDFGGISSDVFMNVLVAEGIPQYSGGMYDSLVLTLAIDTSYNLGDPNAIHTLSVYQLDEVIPEDTVFSNQTFKTRPELLGRKENLVISEIDTVRIPDLRSDSTTTALFNIIRIPLNQSLGRILFQDTASHADSDLLRNRFAGIYITSDATDGLFALRNGSFLTLYYHDDEGTYEGYNYLFSQPFSNYTRDYSNSSVESVFGQLTSEQQNIYVQGLAGPNARIDLSAIRDLGDVIINHATIELTLDDFSSRDTLQYPIASALTLTKNVNGQFERIQDVNLATFFGTGRLYNENIGRFTYEMNVTSHVIGIIKGDEPEDVYLRVTDHLRNPASAILYGPNHPEFPVKLKVTYTKL